MFDVGEKVVCVNDKFPDSVVKIYTKLPVEGQVYVVRDIVAGQTSNLKRDVAILLVGIIAHINQHGIENGFNAKRFVRLEKYKETLKMKKKNTNKETVKQ